MYTFIKHIYKWYYYETERPNQEKSPDFKFEFQYANPKSNLSLSSFQTKELILL